ncbi:MAG: tubulin-like doman-containing protein [Firmicutes bacterium]|nr:tubulin-like doman-containing protein [Bacillota bacterium]
MKLSAEIKSELQSLDCEYGGGISTSSTRTDVIDKPILIIGLGGTGAEALIRVKRSINKQFKLGVSASGRRLDKPPQIEYMAIDSDNNMQNLSYAGTTLSNDEFMCLDTANLTSIYKNRDTVFKNSTQSWIADNLRLQQVKHGAGGIRQAGRLLLTINCNSVISMLTEKINRLVTNRKANDLLYVFITTGCAGGTGSGIFIDVPYLIRKIAEQKGFETENIGMIFLPDVTLSDSTIDGSAALNIKANGFAALKELDYLMNIERNGETFEQTYADLDIKASQPPYDLCHLISAKDENGKLAPSAKDYCMNVAAETIINFIASEEVIDGQSYTISSYLSNIENNKSAFIMTHQQKQPVNYIYNTVGASSAALPIEYLINYLTWKMFSELDNLNDNTPTFDDSQLMLESFKLDLPTLERRLSQDRPPVRDFKQYDHTVLQERPDILEDAVKKELSKLEDHYNKVANQVIEDFMGEIQDKNNVFLQHFTDLETGPFYTLKALSDLHEYSTTRIIDNIRKRDIQQKREHRDNLAALDVIRKTAAEKLRKRSLLSLGKKSRAAYIVETNENYLRMSGRNLMYDAIDRVYNTVSEELRNFYDQKIDSYCELLTAFRELFVKFKDTERTKAVDANFAWDLEDARVFCETFEEDSSAAIDYKMSLKRLLQDMIQKPGWTPGPTHTIVENLNSFVAQQFQSVAYKSLDHYCNMMADEKELSLEEYVSEKLSTLNDSAKVMFPINHIPSGLHITFPPYAYLSVPSNAPKIRNVIKNMGGKIPNIKYSKMNNRLYMLNLKIAVALYCYKELNDYENVYESSLGKIAGIHLYESSTRNWKNLPSPLYDKLWTKDHENHRERLRNNRLREIFDQAIEAGIIRHDEQARRLIGYFGDPIDLYKKFAKVEANIAERTLSAAHARAIIAELNAFLTDPAREKYSVPLFDTEYIPDTDTPDLEYAKGVFIYMPALSEYITKEIQMRQYISQLQDTLTKIDVSEVKYNHFAQLLYMGTISKNRKNYRYAVDGEYHILYTTQTISEQYVEFDLFQAYLALDEGIASHLQKRAQEEENRCTDEQFLSLVKTIDGYIKVYKEKLDKLEENYASERDGAIKKLFYQTMLNVFIREKKVLS